MNSCEEYRLRNGIHQPIIHTPAYNAVLWRRRGEIKEGIKPLYVGATIAFVQNRRDHRPSSVTLQEISFSKNNFGVSYLSFKDPTLYEWGNQWEHSLVAWIKDNSKYYNMVKVDDLDDALWEISLGIMDAWASESANIDDRMFAVLYDCIFSTGDAAKKSARAEFLMHIEKMSNNYSSACKYILNLYDTLRTTFAAPNYATWIDEVAAYLSAGGVWHMP